MRRPPEDPSAPRRTAGGSPSRAGRNLPAAIVVGLLLVALILISLTVPWGWVPLSTAAVTVAVFELHQGMSTAGVEIPRIPALAGPLLMMPPAYFWGPTALLVGLGLTVLAAVVARGFGPGKRSMSDLSAAIFVAAYAPFLGGFTSLMLAEPDGTRRIVVFVLVSAMSDVGGYAAGVLAGKHPMAPTISPKKSWEGFGGGAAACVVSGAVAVPLLLGGAWWAGALVGLAGACFATMGDLTESMVKRDLGIKDMGSILPGHGGLLDRIDSLIMVAPVAWFLLAVLVPVG